MTSKSQIEALEQREKGVQWVPFYKQDGTVEMVPVPWGGDECWCPKNCPGNHSSADRAKLGPAIVAGKVRRTN